MSAVVCSGVGLSTCLGDGVEIFWQGLLRHGGLAAPPKNPTSVDFAANAARRAAMADQAVREALAQARLPGDGGRWLVVETAQADDRASDSEWSRSAERAAPLPEPLAEASRIVLSHACASAGFALALGRSWLRSRRVDYVLVFGACARTDQELRSMTVTRTLTQTHARPFDPQRDGTVVGRGAGALVLERRETAAKRAVTPLATLAGVACRVGGGSQAGVNTGTARDCVEAALADAGYPEIGYVHAHGTGTWAGDDAELEVLADVPGLVGGVAGLPVSSHKGRVGHLLHCSMYPSVAAALGALRERVAPGTPGLGATRMHGELRLLRDPQPCPELSGVLVNGFGFGDNNVALVLTRDAADRKEIPR